MSPITTISLLLLIIATCSSTPTIPTFCVDTMWIEGSRNFDFGLKGLQLYGFRFIPTFGSGSAWVDATGWVHQDKPFIVVFNFTGTFWEPIVGCCPIVETRIMCMNVSKQTDGSVHIIWLGVVTKSSTIVQAGTTSIVYCIDGKNTGTPNYCTSVPTPLPWWNPPFGGCPFELAQNATTTIADPHTFEPIPYTFDMTLQPNSVLYPNRTLDPSHLTAYPPGDVCFTKGITPNC